MAIDIRKNETVVSPARAAAHCPERRKGARPNIATVYRWMVDGIRGIKLESIACRQLPLHFSRGLAAIFDRLTTAADTEYTGAVIRLPSPSPA